MQTDTARRIDRHSWRLLKQRLIKPRDHTIFLWLLWKARKPGQWGCDPTYQAIADNCGICRDQAIKAVRRLTELGLITKRRRHSLVRWGRNRSQVAARQVSNCYTFCVCAVQSKESSGQAADSSLYIDRRGSDRLEAALAGLGALAGLATHPRFEPIVGD